MKVSLISTCTEPLSEREFVDPILKLVEKQYSLDQISYFHYDQLNNSSLILASDRIIICGTSLQDEDYLKNINRFKFILNSNVPTLGICSGMQIISLLGGSKIVVNREIGIIDVTTIEKNKLCEGNFQAFSIHNYSISENSKLKILATSSEAPQVVKLSGIPIYGVSFHPEVRNETIISNFIL